MILFYGEGRFGNQIFQYHALSHIAKPGDRIFAVGLEDLQRHLSLHGPVLIVLTRRPALKRFIKYVLLPFLVRPLSRHLRIVNYVCEPIGGPTAHEPSGLISMRPGLLSRISFVDGGHYQNSALWSSLFPTDLMDVKPGLRSAARRFLDSNSEPCQSHAFVHVRRGDYLQHSQNGLASVALPLSYYRHAINALRQRVGNAHLFFVTDDSDWVEQNFKEISRKTIASFDAATDFAIMTECCAGVVSNSTFALAAAYMQRAPELVIIPRYWFGFGINRWSPPRIYIKHLKLMDVAVDE